MMEALREVTVWEGVSRQPNHIYLLDGDRAMAYIKWGEGEPVYLSGRMKIDRRGRKFVKADIGLFDANDTKSDLIEVAGSRGNVYHVDPEARTCTCPGFTFRGACKHITQLVETV
jgi:hypothetical protein